MQESLALNQITKGPLTLIAERYERRSLGITSNLVFSQHTMATHGHHSVSCTWPKRWSETGGEPARIIDGTGKSS